LNEASNSSSMDVDTVASSDDKEKKKESANLLETVAIWLTQYIQVQWKPLNVITSGKSKSDNINRMITITDYFYLVVFNKWDA
jgi:hypothetical protein